MIEYKKTDLDKLDEYISLYSKTFKNFSKTKNYFKWLYKENPYGKFVGIDCYSNNTLIGQVGGIPHEFIFKKSKVRFLISVNVCVHPKYQGKWIFSKMLVKFENMAKELNFDGIIGVANKAATPFWKRSIKMRSLGPLDVFIGFGKFKKRKINILNYDFYTLWSQKILEWRLNNPINKSYQNSTKEVISIYSKTNYFLIDAYSPLVFFDKSINLNLPKKIYLNPLYLLVK